MKFNDIHNDLYSLCVWIVVEAVWWRMNEMEGEVLGSKFIGRV